MFFLPIDSISPRLSARNDMGRKPPMSFQRWLVRKRESIGGAAILRRNDMLFEVQK